MFIEEGTTRIVYGFPDQGIVVKVPRAGEACGEFGILANKTESYLWDKTHNVLLAPVLYSKPSGEVVVMTYCPRGVRQGKNIKGGLPVELKESLLDGTFFRLTEKILGAHIKTFVSDAHLVQGCNFRLTDEGILRMSDYGVHFESDIQSLEEFIVNNGQKLVDDYHESPIANEYLR